MHHAWNFGRSHSSGMKQSVEDWWNHMGKPQRWHPQQVEQFFQQHMREGRADEVNAIHLRAGQKWEVVGDMVREHVRNTGMSAQEWARAGFGPMQPRQAGDMSTPRLGSDPMAMASQASSSGQQAQQRIAAIDRELIRHNTGIDPRDPEQLGRLSDERRKLRQGVPEALAVARSKAMPRRPTQAAQPQHFDIGAALPPDMRPQNFIELEAQKFEIIQYLVNTQGLSSAEANRVISNIEVDLMNAAS